MPDEKLNFDNPPKINKSFDFQAKPPDLPPVLPPVPPSPLPPMGRGELRDMIHSIQLHVLDLEARMAAVEKP